MTSEMTLPANSPLEGVTPSVAMKMIAVSATVLREDGLLLRTCEHGVKHPVGNIYTGEVTEENTAQHHERNGQYLYVFCKCCPEACCQSWLAENRVEAEQPKHAR